MQTPYTNSTPAPVHVDGKRILPGETRLVDARAVRAPAATPTPDEPEGGGVVDLLAGTASEVIATLPDLSDDQLADLAVAEPRGKARKTVIEAVAAEQLSRADQDDDDDDDRGDADARADETDGEDL